MAAPFFSLVNIFYVSKQSLDSLNVMLQNGEEIPQDLVLSLGNHDHLADDDVMVPVDLSGAGVHMGGYDSVGQMAEDLGPRATAMAFVQAERHLARECEDPNVPAELRPQPMTAAEWRQFSHDLWYYSARSADEVDEDISEDDEEELESETSTDVDSMLTETDSSQTDSSD